MPTRRPFGAPAAIFSTAGSWRHCTPVIDERRDVSPPEETTTGGLTPPRLPETRRALPQTADVPHLPEKPEGKEPFESLGIRRLGVLALAGAWVAGVLVLLARWAAGWAYLRRLGCTAAQPAGPAADLLAACRADLGLRVGVRLGLHPAVRSPVLFGLGRPVILVPDDWPALSAAAQRAGLLHELAHLARGDHRLVPLLQLVRVLFFFHPGVRWLLARLERERELLCDEAVVALGVEPHDYARILLEFAGRGGRLGPALLSIAATRTIAIRIRRLLEGDMVHRYSLPSRRRLLPLGALVALAAAGLGSLRLAGREPQPAPEPPAPERAGAPEGPAPAAAVPRKEALRYGGKSFEQWREGVLTELDPTTRVKGIKAFGAFGSNGHGAEAVQAILDVVKAYDWNTPDPDELEAAKGACRKIGAAAVPVLQKGLKDPRKNVREFAVIALGDMGYRAKAAGPALIEMMRDEDLSIRVAAIDAVASVDETTEGFVPALSAALKDKAAGVRQRAASILSAIGPGAKAAVPALVEALEDSDLSVRREAVNSLSRIAPGDASLVPALAARVKADDHRSVRILVIRYFGEMGPKAKAAVPALIEALKDNETQSEAVAALSAIGPDAKAAVPVLKDLLQLPGGGFRGDVDCALRRIDK
jgi:HEAT repeat protein/beta-lactamase regulating signal transducer with metallopeptidase domain